MSVPDKPKTPLLYLKSMLGVDIDGKNDFMDEWKTLSDKDKKELREQAEKEINESK
tara:strand:+ start:393 stop:560 length:168 start_codon:yes stop_codon:yes gene_type:complete